MMTLILLIFIVYAVGCLVLLRFYQSLSLQYVRTQARQGDLRSKKLYRVLSHQANLEILLITKALLSAIIGISILSYNLDPVTFGVCMFLLAIGTLALINSSYSIKLGKLIDITTNAILVKELKFLYKFLSKLVKFVNYKPKTVIIHSKDELIHSLENQSKHSDINKEELAIIRGALNFGDKTVKQTMTPRKVVKMISANETIGPILMDELHKSGFSRFPVFVNSQDNIVGTLLIKNLLEKYDGQSVSRAMDKKVFYVNEEDKLDQVFDAFIKTKHHLFIVVNNFEEMVGVISMEDVIENIIGKQIVDEFDEYENLRQVALKHTHHQEKSSQIQED